MELLQVSSIENAREQLISCIGDWDKQRKDVAISEASGKVLAVDVFAGDNIPAFRRSMVDGYAVMAKDLTAASESLPVFLKVQGTVEMGQAVEFSITGGKCGYVPTGGMLPDGADAVVMVEYCEPFGDDGIAVYQSAAHGENVVEIGEDASKGSLVLKKGNHLSPQAIGVLAAVGFSTVTVYEPLRLSIISTGDELISPYETPKPGQVRDINTSALKALAEKNGYFVNNAVVLRDDENELQEKLRQLMKISDLICVSGGSSQGDKDFTRKAIDKVSMPGVFLHGLAIKPGKPTILGYDSHSRTIFAGLPGHPVSAVMIFELLFSWISRQYTCSAEPFAYTAILAHDIASSPGKTTCQPVRLIPSETGYIAEPVFGKSGLITTLTNADGYVLIDRNREGLRAGDLVSVHLI